MKIAIIGVGKVGRALRKGWARGHDIVFGVRDPRNPKVEALVKDTGASARAASAKEHRTNNLIKLCHWAG